MYITSRYLQSKFCLFIYLFIISGLWLVNLFSMGYSIIDNHNSSDLKKVMRNNVICILYTLKKLTITYLAASKAFQAFPTSTLECVELISDTNTQTGCFKCNSHALNVSLDSELSLTYSFWQQIPTSGCKLKSTDGLTTVYCSKQNNGNRPKLSYNCYQGQFSAKTPLKPTVRAYAIDFLNFRSNK